MARNSTRRISRLGIDVDVLVVDDEEANRCSLAEILRRAGFSVSEAENGSVALDLLRSTSVGIVLLDLNMPVLDGFEFLDGVEESQPVVVVTARRFDAGLLARKDKLKGYLQKPFDAGTLLRVVDDCLNTRGAADAADPTEHR